MPKKKVKNRQLAIAIGILVLIAISFAFLNEKDLLGAAINDQGKSDLLNFIDFVLDNSKECPIDDCDLDTTGSSTSNKIYDEKDVYQYFLSLNSCTSTCTSGEKACEGNGYKTCVDTNGCFEWSGVTNCESNEQCQNGVCVPISICIDTDITPEYLDGKNYFKAGIAHVDGYVEGNAVRYENDYCESRDELVEIYCGPDGVESTKVKCGEGKECVLGACVDIPTVPTLGNGPECMDTDGNDKYVQGIVFRKANVLPVGSVTSYVRDECVRGPYDVTGVGYCLKGNNCYVREVTCNSMHDKEFNVLSCPEGCNNGKCEKTEGEAEKVSTCTDSDGGTSQFVKGEVQLTDVTPELSNLPNVVPDHCTSTGDLVEYFCDSNGLYNFKNILCRCTDGKCN